VAKRSILGAVPGPKPEALSESGLAALSEPMLDAISDLNQAPKWFALYTTARHEKRVAEHLGRRQIEYYLPLYRANRRWSDGSRVTLDLPLFPGYLFIHIRRNERGSVLTVPGAVAVVGGTGGEPATLADTTIEELRTGLNLRGAQPHPLVTVGQRVRIRSGALEGLEGIVVRHKNGFRVVMTLKQIMQSYAVEVDADDLEPLSPGDLSHMSAYAGARGSTRGEARSRTLAH
jgi:transcription antitermination factor NusG